MPINMSKDWDELRKRVEIMQSEKKQLEFQELCNKLWYIRNQNYERIKHLFEFLDKTRAGRKAFIIGIALILMHELCGCFTMLNYTATIFRDSGSSISPEFSAIIVGVIQLLGTYVATFLVDKLGRKILLVCSSIGSSLCLACLGMYSYFNSIGIDVEAYSWVSIVSFSGMMFLAASGLIPLMFVVIAEVMPEKVENRFYFFILLNF